MKQTPVTLNKRERSMIPHQEMELRAAHTRIHNFEEVPIGYSDEQARLEALRCLHCSKPHCIEACPVGIDIPGFLRLIEQGNPGGAAKKNQGNKFLTGRVRKSMSARQTMPGRVCGRSQ